MRRKRREDDEFPFVESPYLVVNSYWSGHEEKLKSS